MIYKITGFKDIDGQKLMALYRESNRENTDYFYPELTDKEEALKKAEQEYLRYIKNDFLSAGSNEYWILEENGVWVCALRLYKIRDTLYYIEALETHPDFRKMGYAKQLLSGVIEALKKRGPFRLCDCVDKKNPASLKTHESCGFAVVSDAGYDYLSNEASDQDYGMQYAYPGERLG